MSALERQQRASVEPWESTRAANRRVAHAAERLQFVSRMPLFCECDTPDCDALLLISREDFAAVESGSNMRLTAPGHPVSGATHDEKLPGYWLQRSS
jgi:hypothetical protein